jgi:uncharacterized protein YjdB
LIEPHQALWQFTRQLQHTKGGGGTMRSIGSVFTAILATALALAGCKGADVIVGSTSGVVIGDTSSGRGTSGIQLQLFPKNISCPVGGRFDKFEVSVNNTSDKGVIWSSTNKNIATVDQNGVVQCLSVGQVAIWAKAHADTTAAQAATVTVSKAEAADTTIALASPPTVTVRVTGSGGICANDISAISVTVKINGQVVKIPIKFVSLDPSIVQVSDTGLVTGLKVGTAVVRAELVGNSNKSVPITVNVILCATTPPPSGVTISVSPSAVTLQVGPGCTSTDFQLSVTVSPSKPVTWSSSNTAFATVSPNGGLVSPKNPGTVTITASATGDDGIVRTSTSTITVVACSPPPSGASVSVSPTTLTLQFGLNCSSANVTITSTVSPVGTVVTWTSSNNAVVTVTGGVVTVHGTGPATITASVTGADGITHTATTAVTVNSCTPPAGDVTITVAPSSLSLQFGSGCTSANTTLVATVQPAGTTVSWTSSDNNIATISNAGVVTVKASGFSNITASITVNGVTKTFNVPTTVTACSPPPSGATISVSPTSMSLVYGTGCTSANAPIVPTVTPAGTVITWTSSNTAVATAPGGIVIVQGTGPATITASVTGADGITHSVTVSITVTACTVPSPKPTLVINPINQVFHYGSGCVAQMEQLTFHQQNADGTTVSQPQVDFTIAPQGIATISSGGLLTTVAPGDATVTGKLHSDPTVMATIAVHVDNQTCVSSSLQITISPPGGTCSVGQTIPLNLTITPYTAGGSWASSNSSVGSVTVVDTLHAIFHCLSVGTTDVSFSVGGKTGVRPFTVNTAPQPSITLTGPSSVPVGQMAMYVSAVSNSSDQVVLWTSTNTAIFTVNQQTGLLTMKKVGSANLCATLNSNPAIKTCVTITGTSP